MILGFAVLAMLTAIIGGIFPVLPNLSRKTLARIFSARAGILLAVSFTELLPEAWSQSPQAAGWAAVLAFAGLMVLGRFIISDACPEYIEDCHVHYIGWLALFALSAHSFMDGFNMAVSFKAGLDAGLAVAVALTMHKIADGFTITSLLRQGGYSSKSVWALLVLIASATPLGSLASLVGTRDVNSTAQAVLLGFAAGSFIYIAALDIVPRLHKDSDKKELAYFGLGLVGMLAIRALVL